MENHEINIVVENEFLEQNRDLLKPLFGDEVIEFVTPEANMFDILVKHEFFKSKGDAKKNWGRTGRDIPEGFTDLEHIGKKHRRLTIYNPTDMSDIPSGEEK